MRAQQPLPQAGLADAEVVAADAAAVQIAASLAGRVVSFRDHGKSAFADIRDAGGLSIFCHPYWVEGTRYNVAEALIARHFADQPFISAILFDLASVPRGAPIKEASLRLTGLQADRFDAGAGGGGNRARRPSPPPRCRSPR